MLSQEHAKTFQNLFREHSFPAGNVIDEPRITILNRKSDRRFRKLGRLQRLIKRVLGVKPKLVYFEEMEFFPEQVETMAKTDLLLTPHGAQESLLFALPPCADVLVEAFPYGYALPYYFGSLAALFGVRHGFLYIYGNASHAQGTTQRWRTTPLRESIARKQDLDWHVTKMTDTLLAMKNEWEQCRQQQRRAAGDGPKWTRANPKSNVVY